MNQAMPPWTVLGALVLALGLLLAGGPWVVAQDVTTEDVREGYPVAIHPGTCEEPIPRPEHDLGNALPPTDDISIRGASGVPPVVTASQTIEQSLDDLLEDPEPYVVIVHKSAEEYDTYLACGAIGGIVDDDRLVVGLQPVDDSGFMGVAILSVDQGLPVVGDESTRITIHVFRLDEPVDPDVATPEPAPEDTADVVEEYAHPEWLVDADELMDFDEPAVRIVAVVPLDEFGLGLLPGEDPEVDDDDLPRGQIPGAVQIDWPELEITDTSDEALEQWREEMSLLLTTLGMDVEGRGLWPDDTVVIYDDGTLHAARLWWVLDYLGHEDKRILNGGLPAWFDADLPAPPPPADAGLGAPVTEPEPTPYPVEPNHDALATLEDVQASLDDPDIVLVDARSAEAYAEGHIPGAVNIEYTENAEPEEPRYWKAAADLGQLYAEAGVTPDKRIIAYCDTGVLSAVTYFTLRLLGYEQVQLYTGSWVEWSSYPDLPQESEE